MILTRYLARSVFANLAGIGSLLLVIFISNRFVNYLAEAVGGEVSGSAILTLILLKLPVYVGQLLPLATMLAILVVFGRLYRDNEMPVLFSSGIGPGRLALMVLRMTLPVTVAVALLVLVVSPWAMEREFDIKAGEKSSALLRSLNPGRFTQLGGGRGIFYVENLSADGQRLEHVFVASTLTPDADVDQQPRLAVMASSEARHWQDPDTGDHYVTMDQGDRYEGVPGQGDFRLIHFDRFGLRMETRGEVRRTSKREGVSTASLITNATPKDRAELEWRLGVILSVPLLALLAVPLSRTEARQSRFARILPALLVYITYVNLLSVSRVWIEHEARQAWLGLWWVHALLLLLVLVLLPGRFGWHALLGRRRPRPERAA